MPAALSKPTQILSPVTFHEKDMKYIAIVGDGMADYPLKELGGRTPLEAARTPNMDFIAREGIGGLLKTIPQGMPTGSDVANLSLLGYRPENYYTGRGPLEAVSAGVELANSEVAFRCNFITVSEGKIEDFTAGHISSGEAKELIELLNESRLVERGRFYPGVSYRNLFIAPYGNNLKTAPPHDTVGEEIEGYLPKAGGEAERLASLILASRKVLEKSEVNRKREKEGKKPANMVWLWGQGRKPELPGFEDTYCLSGAVIAGVDLIKGIGIYAGLKAIDVPGATGYYDTSYRNKAEYALKALEEVGYCLIHVEAPDEASHEGSLEMKLKTIEAIDEQIVGRLLREMQGDFTIAVLTDHPTPIEVGTHTREEVPFAVYSPRRGRDKIRAFSEKEAGRGQHGKIRGWEFIKLLLE